ncbi:MAG: 4-hydroxyphenylacetate 3-hydroxylase N-terminal domain-containing protein [Porticoccaceae bacterium]
MAVRNGQAYIEGLKDGREVWYNGERVDDVTTFPEFKGAVTALASLYDMQHDPAHRGVLTVDSPEVGEVISRSYQIPRTQDDLRLLREAYTKNAEATCGMMGRSPDFLNIMMASLAAKKSFFSEFSQERADALVNYYHYVAKNDLFFTHALISPQLDKSKARHEQDDPSIPLRVVGKNSEGIIVNGAKRIATAAPYADELMVWPFPPGFQPGEEPYANVFSIPMNTPGLKTICRSSFAKHGDPSNHPLSSRFDEMDATVIFDNVLVPWDRVFLHEDINFLNRMYKDTRMRELTAHQTNTRLEVKLGFLYAVALRMAEATGVIDRPDIVEKLGEAAVQVEVIRNTTRSAEAQATLDPENGVLYPDLTALQVGRALGPVYYPAMLDLIMLAGGGGLIQLPVSMSEFDSPIGDDLERSLRGAGISGLKKAELMKLAWDLCGSEFGSRHELYEKNYAGERRMVLAGIHREYSRKKQRTDHLDNFMESL